MDFLFRRMCYSTGGSGKTLDYRSEGSVFLKKMGKMLCASSRKEKLLLYFSYILNFFLIATIIMIVYALRMGTRELSGSDADQADDVFGHDFGGADHYRIFSVADRYGIERAVRQPGPV